MVEPPRNGGPNDGRFKEGERRSPATEFKRGTHWRPPQPFREKAWLAEEYVAKQRSTGEIAAQFGVTDASILHWLHKHGIPRRTVAEARAIKHWGLTGPTNGMFGKRGAENGNWKGGVSPERAALYISSEWAETARVVWHRDRATCQRCGAEASQHTGLYLHHIVSFAVRELRTDPSNLVLLCTKCHGFVHSTRNTQREFIGEA